MILKSEIEFHGVHDVVLKMGMEQVIDDEEQAIAFGVEAAKLTTAFMNGYSGEEND